MSKRPRTPKPRFLQLHDGVVAKRHDSEQFGRALKDDRVHDSRRGCENARYAGGRDSEAGSAAGGESDLAAALPERESRRLC
jgi:hypothetical protein